MSEPPREVSKAGGGRFCRIELSGEGADGDKMTKAI